MGTYYGTNRVTNYSSNNATNRGAQGGSWPGWSSEGVGEEINNEIIQEIYDNLELLRNNEYPMVPNDDGYNWNYTAQAEGELPRIGNTSTVGTYAHLRDRIDKLHDYNGGCLSHNSGQRTGQLGAYRTGVDNTMHDWHREYYRSGGTYRG